MERAILQSSGGLKGCHKVYLSDIGPCWSFFTLIVALFCIRDSNVGVKGISVSSLFFKWIDLYISMLRQWKTDNQAVNIFYTIMTIMG